MQEESIVVIGNGGALTDSKLGSKIDSFDKVFRFNNWKTLLYEQDAGTKTDVWITYNPYKQINNFIIEYQQLDISDNTIREVASTVEEIWYISWVKSNIYTDWKINKDVKWLGIYDKVIKRHINPEFVKLHKKLIDRPSTGIAAIITLMTMYDKIYIGGFDIYGNFIDCKYRHYYKRGKDKPIRTNKDLNDAPKKYVRGGFVHDPNIEIEILKEFIKDGRVIILNKDTDIEKSKFIGTTYGYRCNKCGKYSTIYGWENQICNYCEGI